MFDVLSEKPIHNINRQLKLSPAVDTGDKNRARAILSMAHSFFHNVTTQFYLARSALPFLTSSRKHRFHDNPEQLTSERDGRYTNGFMRRQRLKTIFFTFFRGPKKPQAIPMFFRHPITVDDDQKRCRRTLLHAFS